MWKNLSRDNLNSFLVLCDLFGNGNVLALLSVNISARTRLCHFKEVSFWLAMGENACLEHTNKLIHIYVFRNKCFVIILAMAYVFIHYFSYF